MPAENIWLSVSINHHVNSSGPTSVRRKFFMAFICSIWLRDGIRSLLAKAVSLKAIQTSGLGCIPLFEMILPLLNVKYLPTVLSITFIWAVKFFSLRRCLNDGYFRAGRFCWEFVRWAVV